MLKNKLQAQGWRATQNSICIGKAYHTLDKIYQYNIGELSKWLAPYLDTELANYLQSLNIAQYESYVKNEIEQFHKENLESQDPHNNLSPEHQNLLETHRLLVDVFNGQEFLWSITERRPSDWAVVAYLKKFPPAIQSELKQKAVLGSLTFDPTKGKDNYWQADHEGNTIGYCNMYKPPIWYSENLDPARFLGQAENYPPLFQYLLYYFFPYQQEREIFLDWLSLAVFDRPEAFLLFRGVRDNGKTMLKQLIFHLIGNFVEAQDGIVNNFNAELRFKRVIGIDDKEDIGSRQGNVLRKRLTNTQITLNEKHVQTRVSEKQWATLIICSNPSEPFYVEYDERKIVSPTLTDRPVKTWPNMTEEMLKWLWVYDSVDSTLLPAPHIDFLKQIGLALFTRFQTRKPPVYTILKGGWFWEDVLQSLPAFKRYLINYLRYRATPQVPLEYELIKAEALADDSRMMVNQWSTISRWLQSGFVFYDQPLSVSIDEDNKSFLPNPYLIARR